jgi:hypothetical protein
VTRKEIIQALKDNLWLAFGGWSIDMKNAALKVGYNDFEVRSHGDMQWKFIAGGFKDVLILRLRPDYEEEPETVKCKVYRDGNCLVWDGHKPSINIVYAASHPDFIGFLYEDDRIAVDHRLSPSPRLYMDKSGYTDLNIDISKIDDYEVLTPTHVLFRKQTDGK